MGVMKEITMSMEEYYKCKGWKEIKFPEQIGRSNWHRNPAGQVDYLPLDVDISKMQECKSSRQEQVYNYEQEQRLEDELDELLTHGELDYNEIKKLERKIRK